MKAGRVLAMVARLGGAIVVASGCGVFEPYDCAELLECDVINEDGTSNGACEGKCVPDPLSGFEEPALVWIGPEELRPLACAGVLPDAPIDLSAIESSNPRRTSSRPSTGGPVWRCPPRAP
ncbi:hypothetical protein WMF38_19030 [Sorangium sp. So ce118]